MSLLLEGDDGRQTETAGREDNPLMESMQQHVEHVFYMDVQVFHLTLSSLSKKLKMIFFHIKI